MRRLAGIDVPTTKMLAIFGALGFDASGSRGQALSVVAPSWRPDIDGKADLVEEIVRIIGVDEVPSTPLTRAAGVAPPVLTTGQKRTRAAKRALAASGLAEAMTWSFISTKEAVAFGGGEPALTLVNPISADMSDMRPSLLPGLIAAAKRNADRGFGDLALFEVGQIYRGVRPEDQFTAATGIRRGTDGVNGGGRHWSGAADAVSVFDAKADLMALLDALGAPTTKLQIVAEGPAWFHPGRVGTIQLGPKNILGVFGELHPSVLEALDADGPIVGFEAILEALPAPKARATRTKPPLDLVDLQPVRRDFAFVVDRTVPAANIIRAAENADRKLVTGVAVFDLFEGASLGTDKKSIAIEVTLQPTERTLTDAEIDAAAEKIVADVAKATGAALRG